MKYTCPTDIAILLAAYNAEKYLDEQLKSLLTQTNSDWTLYIRNDGSTDNTQAIIEMYVASYPDRIIQIDKGAGNLGCNANFFRLLDAVEADYYMFCDADDVWFPEKVSVSYNHIRNEENAHPDMPILAFSDCTVCDAELNVLEKSYWKSAGINPYRFLSFNYLAISGIVGGARTVFNRKVKDLAIPFHEKFMYDHWISLQTAKSGLLSVIDTPLLYYRQHGNNVCGVAVGEAASLSAKIKNLPHMLREYYSNAQLFSRIGYGSFIKYFYYKLLVALRNRF